MQRPDSRNAHRHRNYAGVRAWRCLRFFAAAFGFALIWLPLLCLVIWSFRVHNLATDESSWSLANYVRVARDPSLVGPLFRSLIVALSTAVLAGVIGTASALAARRSRFAVRNLPGAFGVLTLALPEVVLGIGLLVWFSVLRIELGFVSLLIAHTTFCIGYVFVSVEARLARFEAQIEEAATDLGATPFQAFRLVTLPMLAPAIFAGAALAFVLSFDDFVVSFFTTGVGFDTLPIKLYSMIKFGLDPGIYALSTLLLVLTSAGAWLVLRETAPRRISRN